MQEYLAANGGHLCKLGLSCTRREGRGDERMGEEGEFPLLFFFYFEVFGKGLPKIFYLNSKCLVIVFAMYFDYYCREIIDDFVWKEH